MFCTLNNDRAQRAEIKKKKKKLNCDDSWAETGKQKRADFKPDDCETTRDQLNIQRTGSFYGFVFKYM